MNKAIITVVGQDTVGIIARVCTYLSAHQVNVLDISQTIIDGFFNMMMIVDYSNADEEFGTVVDDLDKLGEEIGVRIRCVKSNAILIAHNEATVGIGMGQVNRVDSCHLAVDRANTLADGKDRVTGSVAASDAFFPFADGAEVLMSAGVKAIVQPGGSIRDEEVIEAAKNAGVTMYLTGTRHFLH